MNTGELGVFNLVLVTSSMLMPFFSLNMTDGSTIYFSQERSADKIHTMYLTVVNAVILSTLLCSALVGGLGLFVKHQTTAYLPWIILLIWANTFSKVALFLFAIYQQTGLILKNTVLRDLGIAVGSVLLVVLGYSYQGLLFANIAVTAITAWLLFRIVNRELPYAFTLDLAIAKQFIWTALPLLPVFLFSWAIQSSDYYFLAYFHGTGVVGKYGVVYSIASVIMCLTYALNFFWYPVSARLWVDDREKYRAIFRVIFVAFTAGLLLAVVLFELNARWIMALLARKPEYQDAFVIMGTISFAYSMQVLITLLTAPLYSNLNVKTIFASYFSGGVVNLLMNIWLIPGSGLIGAAISTAVSYLVVTLLLGYFNYRVAAFRFLDARLGVIVPIFLALWGASLAVQRHTTLAWILPVDLALLVGTALLTSCVVLRPAEKEFLLAEWREVYSRFKRER